VPKVVIDPLEMVNIEHQETERSPVTPRVSQLRGKPHVEVLAIVRTGQGVSDARIVEMLKHRQLLNIRHRIAASNRRAKLDDVTVTQPMLGDPLRAHVRAVGAPKILNEMSPVDPSNLGVATTDTAIGKRQIAALMPTNHELVRVEFHDEADVLPLHPHQDVAVAHRNGRRPTHVRKPDDRRAILFAGVKQVLRIRSRHDGHRNTATPQNARPVLFSGDYPPAGLRLFAPIGLGNQRRRATPRHVPSSIANTDGSNPTCGGARQTTDVALSATQPITIGAQERKRLTGRAGIVAGGTLGSRVLGMFRDQVIAATFATPATDAFFVAFMIPNVLRQLLAEGAVQNAALPVLEQVRERSGASEAKRVFASMRGLSILALVAATALGIAFARPIVDLFATGYRQHPGQFERTVALTRWIFPYIFFMGTAALGVAALNVHRHFFVTSFAPALLNVAFIAAALILPTWLDRRGHDPVMALAVGALVGGVLQVVAQWPSLHRIGYLSMPRLELRHPAIQETLRRMGPVLLGIGVYYVDVVLARRFLSELEPGSQSYFGWALRLCDFPQGIFVMALQSATLPSLTRLVARGELQEVRATFSYAMRLTLFVAIAASMAAVALAEPLTILIFQRGQFNATTARETARALMAQGSGIWMVAAVRQLVSVFYAFGDTKTPVRVAAMDLCVFIVLALFLRRPLGHLGVSLAVTGASFAQMTLLWMFLRRRLSDTDLHNITRSALKTILCGLIAAAVGFYVAGKTTVHSAVGAWALAKPGILSVLSFGVVFLALAWLLRSEELQTLIAGFRRTRHSSSNVD
jgi:putative peptidoglycan lipid II flippase